jgi:hypothetical protein
LADETVVFENLSGYETAFLVTVGLPHHMAHIAQGKLNVARGDAGPEFDCVKQHFAKGMVMGLNIMLSLVWTELAKPSPVRRL